MQVFMPYPAEHRTRDCLDYRRLGKQRVEAKQILQALRGEKQGWKNHPCVRAWAGYEPYLAFWARFMCKGWIARGYRDSLEPWFGDVLWEYTQADRKPHVPPWVGNHEFHAQMRATLLAKDPEHYGQFGWTEEPNLGVDWHQFMAEAA